MSLGNKGGYAVVSADERMPEIISYSTNSDLCTISRNTGAMKMKRMSERVVLSRIAHIELLKILYVKNSREVGKAVES